MSLECNVVQDLIVLFQENTVSEETRREIREHLKGCRDCKKIYSEYTHLNQENFEGGEVGSEQELRYKDVAARIRRRKLWRHSVVIAGFAACIGITVMVTRAILRGEK